ncbi:hypothetical protein [Actinopolyspora halophila]|uniref:hypothetical protein n=1 Tax=Actinopolyspora halophila TaxID=1850 RepID=UPI00035C5847|nr:hypothetical protein [Actinopolyspora halophila]
MADPLDVVTLAEAKAALSIASSVTKHDAELPGFVTAVSQRLDLLVGPIVQRPVDEEPHDGGNDTSYSGLVSRPAVGDGHESVFLDFFPISSITSVSEYVDGAETVLTRETPTVKPAEGYVVSRFGADASLLSNKLMRRKQGRRARFAAGTGNVVASYVAGRAADTASVPQRYKVCAGLMLQNLWRSQQDSTGSVNEFDVPQSYFPRWAIPKSVQQLLHGEIQEPEQQLL